MSPFFGLTSEYSRNIHKSIFEMVTYGKGGWTYDTLYNMPIRLRMLYFKWLHKALEAEAKAANPQPKPKAPQGPR